MKKQYTTPQMEVVEIQTAQMLCASDPVTGVDGNGGWNWGGGSSSGGRGRESDDWDDEW